MGAPRADNARGLPPFAHDLVASGEALAYLHLSGNHCNVSSEATDAALAHTYTTTLSEGVKAHFAYEVLAVFDGDHGHFGKCIVYRPTHAPQRLVVAFRAVRLDTSTEAANRDDLQSMLEPSLLQAPWMPHGATMSRGVCLYAGVIWGMGDSGGLGEFLHTCGASEVHFTGLSLAGSLAQACALRAVTDLHDPSLRSKVHVLTFGALCWLNHLAARAYGDMLGDQCTHFVTRARYELLPSDSTSSMTASITAPVPTWWTSVTHRGGVTGDEPPAEPPFAAPSAAPASSSSSFYDAVDPLTQSYVVQSPRTLRLSHTYAIHAGNTLAAGPMSATEDFDLWQEGSCLALLPATELASVSHMAIFQLMSNSLPKMDPLLVDYMRLHRGRAYKAALRSLTSSVRKDGAQRAPRPSWRPTDAVAAAAAVVTAPAGAEGGGEGGRAGCTGTLRRNNSSKRSLDELLTHPAMPMEAEHDAVPIASAGSSGLVNMQAERAARVPRSTSREWGTAASVAEARGSWHSSNASSADTPRTAVSLPPGEHTAANAPAPEPPAPGDASMSPSTSITDLSRQTRTAHVEHIVSNLAATGSLLVSTLGAAAFGALRPVGSWLQVREWRGRATNKIEDVSLTPADFVPVDDGEVAALVVGPAPSTVPLGKESLAHGPSNGSTALRRNNSSWMFDMV